MANEGISGSQVPCHAVIEQSWGVMPATPIVMNLGYVSFSIDPGGDFISSEESDGKRTQLEPVQGNPKNTMSMDVEFNSANIAFWMKMALGLGTDTDASPGVGLNTHIMSIEESACLLPSATFEFGFTPCGDTLTRYRLAGCRVNQFTWQAQGGTGLFKAKFDLFYQLYTNPGTGLTAIAGAVVSDFVTPSTTVKKLDHTMVNNARILVNGVAKAYSFLSDITITHMNNIQPDYGYGDQGNVSSMLANKAETKADGTIAPKTAADLALFNQDASQTATTLSFRYNHNASGTKYTLFEIGSAKFPKRVPGVASAKQLVKMPFTSHIYRDPAGMQFRVTVVNDQVADAYTLL